MFDEFLHWRLLLFSVFILQTILLLLQIRNLKDTNEKWKLIKTHFLHTKLQNTILETQLYYFTSNHASTSLLCRVHSSLNSTELTELSWRRRSPCICSLYLDSLECQKVSYLCGIHVWFLEWQDRAKGDFNTTATLCKSSSKKDFRWVPLK